MFIFIENINRTGEEMKNKSAKMRNYDRIRRLAAPYKLIYHMALWTGVTPVEAGNIP